ncbi:MAG: oligosaccharide flippase family protein [Candidatus Rokuibacteriota bacterium]
MSGTAWKSDSPMLPAGKTEHAVAGIRIAKNVATNWAWVGLVAIAGFIVPPLINSQLGKDILGIWDFGWALVMYIALLSMGVTSAVNRYVAKFRAGRQWRSLSVTLSSSLALLATSSVLGLAAACALAAFVPRWLPGLTSDGIFTARAVILILCGSAALQLPAHVFNGVITGFERFDLLNATRLVCDLGVLIAMVALLLSGFGLVALALASLLGEVAGGLARISVARRLCPQLRLSPRLCRRRTMAELLRFGGKTIVHETARGGLYQINAIVLAVFVGPAALAVYARQRALVMLLTRLLKQYAQVFTPTSSDLHARGDLSALRHLAITSAKYGFYIALPAVLFLALMGGPLLHVWMGSDYEAPTILTVLTMGHLAVLPQMGLFSILIGMGRHGVPAAVDVVALFVSAALTWSLLSSGVDSLLSAALGLALPFALSGGVVLPLYACRVLGLSPWRYLREVLPGPLLASIPCAGSLLAARAFIDADPAFVLLAGTLVAATVTTTIYWRWVLPPQLREAFIKRLSGHSDA